MKEGVGSGEGARAQGPRFRRRAALRHGLSSEQVPVLTARWLGDRVVLEPPRNGAEIIAALDGRIAPGSAVCSDGLKAYVKVAVKVRIGASAISPKPGAGKLIGGKPRKQGRLGLGRVNNHHEWLKTFINRKRSRVSTRYLANDLGWQRMARSTAGPEALLETAAGVSA